MLNKRIINLLIVPLILFTLSSCKHKDDNKEVEEIIPCEVSSYSIMEGTPYETKCYLFESSVEGPRVALVGGIHGDELSGRNAGLELINKKNYKGTVLLIPQANILSNIIAKRYIGVGNSGKITNSDYVKLTESDILQDRNISSVATTKYTDLNRSFPGNSNGTDTQKLANAIYTEVVNFNPSYIVDFHESRKDYTNFKANDIARYLGNSIIYNSESLLFVEELLNEYNSNYLKEGEMEFSSFEATVQGSFNATLGNTPSLPGVKTFTFETNRETNSLGIDTAELDRRIEQQLELTDLLLKLAYNEFINEDI